MLDYHIRITLTRTTQSDTFLPSSLFQHLPSHTPRTSGQPSDSPHPDYRFGAIRIDWMDFDKDPHHMRKASMSGKERLRTPTRGTTPATALFAPQARSKCGSTNLPEGVVHVYRDAAPVRSLQEQEFPALPSAAVGDATVDGVMLGVLAVPSWMTPSDFLTFVSPAADGISHLRMIRDSAPNRSIVVIKFRKAVDAAEFAEAYNGKAFNSMEPEICHVVHVSSVEIDPEDTASASISHLVDGTATELPTCPVCLERMDSAVTGLVTVPCSHTFHCACLSKWGDSRCPVCRYSQTLLSSHPAAGASASSTRTPLPFAAASTPSASTSSCAAPECGARANLWICLVCGHVGCGRYGRAHAHAHFRASAHVYALELETQRVWDYAGDGYVHRLIQNRADGKLVELPSASMGAGVGGDGRGPGRADALSAEKIEAIGIEYSYLLSAQMDAQREYYEGLEKAREREVREMRAGMERLAVEVEGVRARAEEEARDRARETGARAEAAERRAEKMGELARRLEKELKEERAMSEGLMASLARAKERQREAEEAREALGKKVEDLEDQVRDVMFFLEAKTKIEEGGGAEAEMAGGSIEIAAPAPATPSKTGAKKKKGKKG